MTAQEKLDSIRAKLDEYEGKVGLNPGKAYAAAEFHRWMGLSQAELKFVTYEECGEAALMLSDYAFHVQKLYNKEEALVDWCKEEIWLTIAPQMEQYRQAGQSYEERYYLAVHGNEYTKRLHQLKTGCGARAKQLSFLCQRLENMAEKYRNLQYAKRNQRS